MANSAKQDTKLLFGRRNFAHSDFAGTHSITEMAFEIPVDGWIKELRIQIVPQTPFDQQVIFGLDLNPTDLDEYFYGEQGNEIDGLLEVWQTTDRVGSIIKQNPHFVWLLNGAASTEPIYFQTDFFKFVKGGTHLNFEITILDRAAAPTAGIVDIIFEADFIVANYNGSPKRPSNFSSAAGYMTVLMNFGTESNPEFAIPMPSDCRIYNMRLSQMAAEGEETIWVDKHRREHNNFQLADVSSTGADFVDPPAIYLYGETTTDAVQMTAFEKGPLFMRKGESLHFQAKHESPSTKLYVFQCEIVPDYKNRVTFNSVMYDSDWAAGEDQVVFTFPWDVYVENIEVDGAYVVTGDVLGSIEIHGIKPSNPRISSSLTQMGGILDLGSDTTLTGQRAASILDVIPLANDFSVTDRDKFTSYEMVMDYYPAGSMIIVKPLNAENVGMTRVRVQIEGTNARKDGNVLKYSRVTGEQIYQMGEEWGNE